MADKLTYEETPCTRLVFNGPQADLQRLRGGKLPDKALRHWRAS